MPVSESYLYVVYIYNFARDFPQTEHNFLQFLRDLFAPLHFNYINFAVIVAE